MHVYDYESDFAMNSYYGDKTLPEAFKLSGGSGHVMVSAPHSCRHYRNSSIKAHEFMTGAFAKYTHAFANCPVITTVRYDETDANRDTISAYRDELERYIKEHEISFLLDLHGMKSSGYDLVLGVNGGKNLNGSNSLLNIISSFWGNAGYKLGIDKLGFRASQKHNISFSMNSVTGCLCMQFEISADIRSNETRCEEFASRLVDFVNFLNTTFLPLRFEKNRKSESWYPLNYVLLPKGQATRENLASHGLLSYDLSEVENAETLSVISSIEHDDNKETGAVFVSPGTLKKVLDKGLACSRDGLFLVRRISSYPIKFLYKIDAVQISDDKIFVNRAMYDKLQATGAPRIKLYNQVFSTSAVLNYGLYEENITKKRSNSIWISQKNRILLGIEIKGRYRWYEYERIIDFLDSAQNVDNDIPPSLIKRFFLECYYPSDDERVYEQYGNAIRKFNKILDRTETNEISYKDLRKAFRKLFTIEINPTYQETMSKRTFLDYLIGFSRAKLITGRIEESFEGTNNVKINTMTATILDVQNNERLTLNYNGRKKSCRVIIDDSVDDMEIMVSKHIRAQLEIHQERTFIDVKRDSRHILRKNLESMILSIALTTFTVVSFFESFGRRAEILSLVFSILIWVLIITSTFSDRRQNVQ